ncbi:MAG: energy-coupling factor transporter ATPase [Turicibacter sp.]|nr:energy-coupling factor transporter ATPase [Turicibacter sp.]
MLIKFEDVSYEYNSGTPMVQRVLHDVDLVIEAGTFNCLIGHTGSGKSTLMQHLNALLVPSTGVVTVPGGEVRAQAKTKTNVIREIRQNVGLVFQFPEYQLFETTVLADIMFGPKNYGATDEEAEVAAQKAAQLVGLDEAVLMTSPFELSGGQMRRVAIAGVLAMNPDVLVLDEPTAGLDPRGRGEILDILLGLQKQGKTIVVATHDMDLVAAHAEHVMVMREGRVLLAGAPKEVFSQADTVNTAGIYLPTAAAVYAEAFGSDEALPLTLDEFITRVVEQT